MMILIYSINSISALEVQADTNTNTADTKRSPLSTGPCSIPVPLVSTTITGIDRADPALTALKYCGYKLGFEDPMGTYQDGYGWGKSRPVNQNNLQLDYQDRVEGTRSLQVIVP